MKDKPLQGLRLVELGSVVAGPFCGRLFADFGAEVIKVEPAGEGDPLRTWGQATKDGSSLWWSTQSRNKKCVTINLREKEGQHLARRLIKEADILVENFRPGRLEGWGLSYEDLKKDNPGLIMVRISGFGQDGPYRDKTGFGSVGEAMGGLRYITGYPDLAPPRIGIAIGDSLAAMFGFMGAMMAVYHRDVNGGVGQYIDVALYESVFALMESILPEYDKLGLIRQRTGTSLPKVAPSNNYETSDGTYIVIGANKDNIFRRFAEVMGHPEVAADPRYATHAARGENQHELDEMINGWTKNYAMAELQTMMDEAGVPAGPIYSIADIVKDPQYLFRNMIREVNDSVWGNIKHPGIVPKLSETPGDIGWAGPRLGEHNREIYKELLKLSDTELEQLIADKII
ncbi:MAG: CoA transferase [Dethiobacter sp.]|jgi:succinyl-CoA--D-citramalate CoA-transferase|nr:CoA transferase [Dethiobacter sp.]